MISQAAYTHSLLPPKPVHVPWRLVEWPRSKVKVRGSVSSQSSMPSETWNSSRPEESIESRRYTFDKIGKANIVTRRVAIAAANIIRKSGWEHLIPQQADTQKVKKKGHGDRSLASCIILIRNRNTLYTHDDGSCM